MITKRINTNIRERPSQSFLSTIKKSLSFTSEAQPLVRIKTDVINYISPLYLAFRRGLQTKSSLIRRL